MVRLVQLVEHQIVVLGVVGSSPTSHPKNKNDLPCYGEAFFLFLGRERFLPPPLRGCPQLNVSEVARTIGINKSLLSRYIYGIKRPSEARTRQILDAIRALGREMADI